MSTSTDIRICHRTDDSGARFKDETAASAGALRRGRLVVQRRVVERIASQAAAESGDIGGVSGGLLGVGSQGDLATRPVVGVELVGSRPRSVWI